MAADIRQCGRSRVRNFLLRQNGTVDFIFQIFVGCQRVEQRVQYRLRIVLRNVTLRCAGAPQNSGNTEQLLRL